MEEQEIKKSYYAIIPANVRYNKSLTPNAKLLYAEITALCNEKGFCWASNKYFAELYQVSKISISNWISELEKNNYIKCEIIYKEDTKQILYRYIKIVDAPIKDFFNTPIKENFNTPIKENFNGNITNDLNNKVINKRSEKNARPDKQIYGQYKNVLLTQEEYDKIINQENGPEAIEFLSEYMEMKNYKVKSHYLAIKKWVFDAVKEKQQRQEKLQQFTACDRPYNEEDKYKYSPFTKEQIEAMEAEGVFFTGNYQEIIDDPTGKYTEYLVKI